MKKNKQQKCAVLLATLLTTLPALAVTSGPESRPRQEDYASFSLYLQALFDYQRTQNNTPARAEPAPKQHASAPESLEEAIGNAGHSPGYVDPSPHPRSTFKSFALAQIPQQDMSQSNVADALGIFDNPGLKEPPSTNSRLRPDSDLSLVPDVDLKLIGDAYDIRLQAATNTAIENFSGYILLDEGEAQASVSVQKSTQGDSGIDLSLSAKVRSNVYIADRDGLPGTQFDDAGVVVIRPLALEFSGITSHITAFRDNRNDDVISIQSGSANPITIDLSGSRIGAAAAPENTERLSLNGRRINPVHYFASFGEGAILTIGGGMKTDIRISHSDGMRKPLATVNGKIPAISLENFRLIDQNGESGKETINLNIGKLKISAMDIENLRLYINKKTVVIDTGTGTRDFSISMEQVAIGPNIESSVLGDIYIDHAGINRSRISIAAH